MVNPLWIRELMELVKDHETITLDVELKEYPTPGWEAVSYDVCDRVIAMLEEYGFDIVKLSQRPNSYYLASRQFELAELKLLVDSVQASKFITPKKSRELIGKLETLCSKYEAKQLHRQVVVADRIKTVNENIYYNVDFIHKAIADKEVLT